MPRHFLSLMDVTRDELLGLIDRGIELKGLRGKPGHPSPLAGKAIAILMEKASTRTRISFEVGVHELGGYPMPLAGRDTQLGRSEPLEDTARVLSGYLAGVILRTHGHDRIQTLAGVSRIPFINALTDKFHPCQLLADLMTVEEHREGGLDDLKVAWIGDGNNMAHSWILAAAQVGFELRLACPEGYRPAQDVLETARATGRGSVTITTDVMEAARDADVVTTDVWASMGQEEEAAARRIAFRNHCVTEQTMEAAAEGAIFLHCLPAHRGEEVEAAVIDGPASRVWDEAENRLHAQKALLELLYG
ncbi:MAG: ornithine carbamoyltransferase [Myxococcales bacterium]|jgi:ornithine carbamoyltransferase